MAKINRRPDYRKQYPGLSEKIYKVLEQSDRQMEYVEYDIKVEKTKIDLVKRKITYKPSREDSYERLMEDGNRQFADENEDVEETATNAVMIEKMRVCIKFLTPEEQELIVELFFNGKSEHQLSRQTNIAQRTLHDRKVKILKNLKKLMEM